jgi:hypothetical protein
MILKLDGVEVVFDGNGNPKADDPTVLNRVKEIISEVDVTYRTNNGDWMYYLMNILESKFKTYEVVQEPLAPKSDERDIY